MPGSSDDPRAAARSRRFGLWITIGAPIAIAGAQSRAVFLGWIASFLAYGVALYAAPRVRSGWALAACAAQSGAVLAMVLLLCHGFEGTLMIVVAVQVQGLLRRRTAIGRSSG